MAIDRSLIIALIGILVISGFMGIMTPKEGTDTFGAASKTSNTICSDTDGGQKAFFVGTVNVYNNYTKKLLNSYPDKCGRDNKTLTEYICNARGTDRTSVTITCPGTCSGGECKCYDSDGGINLDVKGTTIWRGGTYVDSCYNTNQVYEFRCDNNIMFGSYPECPYPKFCSNGICVQPVCGNSIIERGETCDRTAISGTCQSLGFLSGTLSCKSDCTLDTSKCVAAVCGDGIIHPGEQCDGHMTMPCQNLSTSFTSGTAFCLQDCKYNTHLCTGARGGWCGDGMVEINTSQGMNEQCDGSTIRKCSDFGFLSGNISCTNCLYDTSRCTRTTNCTTDSDGGYDIFKRGTKTISGTTYTEECGGDTFTEYPYLYEYECSRQNAYVVGRIEGSTYYEGVRGGCINGCFNGRCLPQKYDLTCTDSDNTPINGYGEGRYTKGTTRSTIKQTGEVEEQQDRCQPDNDSIVEFICRPNGFIARTGVRCEVGCSDGACIKPRCGDDIFTFGYEECEGTNLGNQTCESLEAGYGTLSCTSDCRLNMSDCVPATCGDGIVNDDRWWMEECDGNDLNYADCQRLGYFGGNLSCTNECKFDKSGCFSTFCGDGVIQQPNDLHFVELCDRDDLNGRGCTDFGSRAYLGGILSCNEDCTFDMSECITGTYCGDTTVQHPNDAGFDEQCDGNNLEGYQCTNFPDFTGGNLACNPESCTFDFSGCYTGPCRDSDGGQVFGIKGYVTYEGFVSSNGELIKEWDACSGNILNEKYCSASGTSYGIGLISHTCPNGCSDGACI